MTSTLSSDAGLLRVRVIVVDSIFYLAVTVFVSSLVAYFLINA